MASIKAIKHGNLQLQFTYSAYMRYRVRSKRQKRLIFQLVKVPLEKNNIPYKSIGFCNGDLKTVQSLLQASPFKMQSHSIGFIFLRNNFYLAFQLVKNCSFHDLKIHRKTQQLSSGFYFMTHQKWFYISDYLKNNIIVPT